LAEGKAMTSNDSTAKEMARAVGINPKLFRHALRKQHFGWHKHYATWKVQIDSAQHIAMQKVLATLLKHKMR
jgi:hypothetical protein